MANTVTVISGSIRSRDDSDALDVKLSIWDTEITMRSGGSELGNWPASAVVIRALDATSFEFVAEGDHLVFSPDEPEEFRQLSVVSGSTLGSGRRRSRKAKRKEAAAAPPQLRWDEESAEEVRRRSERSKRGESPKAKKPSRRERKAAAAEAAAQRESFAEVEAEPVPEPAPEPEPQRPAPPEPSVLSEPREPRTIRSNLPQPASSHPEPPAQPPAQQVTVPPQVDEMPREATVTEAPPRKKTPLVRRDRAAAPGSVESDHTGGLKAKRHQAWIFTLDQARKYDLFGLDRVPVNEGLRGKEHAHTWDHRVAPESGPGSWICTLCGEIKRSR